MTTNGAADGNPIGGDRGVEALWVAMEDTRQQVAQIHDMLDGFNLNRPPVNRTRAKGFARGQPTDRRHNQTPRNQPDSEDDSDEDDMGYSVAQPARRMREQDDYRLKAELPSFNENMGI